MTCTGDAARFCDFTDISDVDKQNVVAADHFARISDADFLDMLISFGD